MLSYIRIAKLRLQRADDQKTLLSVYETITCKKDFCSPSLGLIVYIRTTTLAKGREKSYCMGSEHFTKINYSRFPKLLITTSDIIFRVVFIR